MPHGETPLSIRPAAGASDLAAARLLFEEYAASLGFDLCFQGFSEELATLPGQYAPPAGRLLLGAASAAGNVDLAGCVALRPLDVAAGEMKRLYVRPAFRGRGLGRALVDAVIAAAREIGYRRICLDTVESMVEALGLYRSLGFCEIAPYRPNPIAGATYLALSL